MGRWGFANRVDVRRQSYLIARDGTVESGGGLEVGRQGRRLRLRWGAVDDGSAEAEGDEGRNCQEEKVDSHGGKMTGERACHTGGPHSLSSRTIGDSVTVPLQGAELP